MGSPPSPAWEEGCCLFAATSSLWPVRVPDEGFYLPVQTEGGLVSRPLSSTAGFDMAGA